MVGTSNSSIKRENEKFYLNIHERIEKLKQSFK